MGSAQAGGVRIGVVCVHRGVHQRVRQVETVGLGGDLEAVHSAHLADSRYSSV